MTRCPTFRSVIAWTLALLHASALLAPAALVVCREADGSTHYELLLEDCCAALSDSSRAIAGDQPSTGEPDGHCQDLGCVDEPMPQHSAVRGDCHRFRRDLPWHPIAAPQTFERIAPPSNGRECGARGQPPLPAGPPSQAVRSLRSTILVV